MNTIKLPRGRRLLASLLGIAFAAGSFAAATAEAADVKSRPVIYKRVDAPEIVLYNGMITTLDAKDSTVEAIAIRDGRIIASGANDPVKALARADTQLIDLGGRRVLPGLIDGHLHGIRMGSYFCFTRSPRFDTIFVRSDAIANVASKAARTPPGKWLFQLAGAWNINQLDVRGMLTKDELDFAAPNHPVYLQGTGFTGGQTNTKGLQALGLAAGSDGVTLDANGQPTGQLTGNASTLAIRTIGTELGTLTQDEQEACSLDFIRELNRRGLTGWDDPGGNNPFSPTGVPDPVLAGSHGYQAINRLYRQGRLNARIRFNFSCFGSVIGLPCVQMNSPNHVSGVGDDLFRIGGIGEEVMNLTGQVYADPEYTTILRYIASNQWHFEHHATSPATQEAMVASWEKVNQEFPITNLRWRTLHPGGGPAAPSAETLQRFRALGAGLVPTDTNVKANATTDHPPYRRIYESGTRACMGTDAYNVSPYPPFMNLWYAVSGKTNIGAPGVAPDQRLTRSEALRMSTVKCAWFLDLEGQVGALKPDYYADLIVLSDDYFTVPDDDIRSITSVLTLVGGRIVYSGAEFAGLDQQ